jgi:transcriptional regulator with XRE-family HTH domain
MKKPPTIKPVVRNARIEEAMSSGNLSRAELARRAGISPQNVSNILARKDLGRVQFSTLYYLAKALGVPLEDLVASEAPAELPA